MKIIYLNCFLGQIKSKLLDFFKQNLDTDFFCLQEVTVSLKEELLLILNDFDCVFEVGFMVSYGNELAGQCIFYKKNITLNSSEKILLHELKTKDIGFYLTAEYKVGNDLVFIGNAHGTPQPADKLDSAQRIEQSELIIKSSYTSAKHVIIGGDFNLLRNTKSIKMFEEVGYENLIEKFYIKATRNNIAWKRFKNDVGFVKQFDSDFIFTKGIEAKKITSPDVQISDHNPLILEFDLPAGRQGV